MNRLSITIAALALLLLAACNVGETDSAATTGAGQRSSAGSETVKTTAESAQAVDSGYQPVAGSDLVLDSGEEVTVLSVGEFDQKLKELSGLIAVEGRVKEAHPELGALILVDCDNMADCGDGCCPQAELPVRMALESFAGELPTADSEVIVVGELTVNDLGYELAVREIRQGPDVLLRLTI